MPAQGPRTCDEVETPTFTTAADAAAWTEGVLKGALRQAPENIHLDSRSTATPRQEDVIHVTELAQDCKRLAYFRITGVPRDYVDAADAHWAHEGWLKEQWTRAVFRAAWPGRLRYQMPVPMLPAGVAGTLDLFWKDANVLYDVKSRSVNTGPPYEKDRKQVATYAAHMPTYPLAVIIHVPRENLSEVACYPVEYDAAKVRTTTVADAAQLQAAIDLKQVPQIPDGYDALQFPCSFRQRDGETKRCPYFSNCWQAAGVVVPAPSTPMMQDLMRRHRALSEEATRLEKEAEGIRHGPRKDLEQQMAAYFDTFGNFVAGPADMAVDLKRIVYAGRTTYDTGKAFAKDPEIERRLEPFKKVGDEYFQHRYVQRKA